jgi:N-acetylglucosaminyl-diphospho-decaprenol L-rhamnosyltransferase
LSSGAALAVVVVTYDSGTTLPATLAALLPQLDGDDELLVVDNGSSDRTPELARAASPRVRVLPTGANLGFAEGCNRGATATRAPLLLFLNPDAQPQPGCLDALRAAATDHPHWGAWQAFVTLSGGERINTSGGVTHYLGFGWAGECDAPVRPGEDREVSFASGAALVVRRTAWERVAGFDADYFMYAEDVDLSLRLRLAGYGIGLARAAVVEHDYEFDKGTHKWLLLETNRWRTVLADYPAPLLLAVLPVLLAVELALLPLAARGGWLREKRQAQRVVLASLPRLLRRRMRVQRTRTASIAAFADALSAELDSPYLPRPEGLAGVAFTAQQRYWTMLRRLIGAAA